MKALVVIAHGLHLGYLGCYGNGWVATPHLDRLAAEGIAFDQHYISHSDGIWAGTYHFPQPDKPALREAASDPLGDLLEQHGIGHSILAKPKTWKHCLQKTLAELDTLADKPAWLLRVDLPSLCPPWRIPKAFLKAYFEADESDEEDEEREPPTPWLDPPLGPINSAEENTWDCLQYTYAAAITHLDEQVGVLLDGFQQRCSDEDVLICFTADSGLALGEHGIIGPARPWPHDELIHVPLLLRLPGGAEAGRRIAALTQSVDLLPTLFDVFALPIPALHGRTLLPLARGQIEPLRNYACCGLQVDDEVEWALRTPEWAFLLPLRSATSDEGRKSQLYVKPDDRWEMNNVVQHHLELAEHLEKTLRDFVAATVTSGPFYPPELG